MTRPGRRRATKAAAVSVEPAGSELLDGDAHLGNLVLLALERYRGVFASSLEAVQNGFDAGATRVVVVVNLRERYAYIADNGRGADRDQVNRAIQNIAFSTKDVDDEDILGRWGIGFVSPTMACDTYTFTTWAGADDVVRQLKFREAEIRQMRKLKIPMEVVGALPTLPDEVTEHLDGEFEAEWRTVVHMRDLKPDRTTSAFDPHEFRRIVRSRFSRVMRNRGALVRLVFVDRKARRDRKPPVIDIDPTVYTGESLGDVAYTSKDTGTVTFRLFVAPEVKSGRYDGEVNVLKTTDNTTVSIGEFSRQALVPGRHVTPDLREAMAALKSGRFAGEIMCDNVTLASSRKGFESDDALYGLFKVVAEWYREHGYIYYEVGREESREQRWRVASDASRERLSRLLSQPRYVGLWDGVFAALSGAVNTGATVKPGRPGGGPRKQDDPAEKSGESKPQGDADETPEGGEKSRRSVGLSIVHTPSRSRQFWSFSFETGELTINTAHEVWGQLDETPDGRHEPRNARWTQEVRDWLALEVIVHLARHPNPDEFERTRGTIDDMVPLYADSMVQRDIERHRRMPSDEGAEGA